MNIAVITKYFYPVSAGIEVNIQETYKKILSHGYTVTIHTSQDTLTEKNVLATVDTVQNLKAKRYPFTWYGFIPKVDWGKIDIVALHNFNVSPQFFIMAYVAILKLFGKKKFILTLTPHGGFNPEWSIFPAPVAFLKKLYHYTIGVLLINASVDLYRAVSEWEKEQTIQKGVNPKIVKVISNGLEDEAFMDVDKKASVNVKKLVKESGPYIIQIGRIYTIKNYETTIRALALLPKNIKYIIPGPIGDHKYKAELEKLIHKIGLDGRVQFVGVIRGVDKYYLIKHAELMVHMAKWESFCNVVHEGLSQGLICIVANNTALPYIIKDNQNGFLIDTYDVKKLVAKISFVLKNKNSRHISSMVSRNKKNSVEKTWTKTAYKLHNEIAKLLYTASN